MVKSRVIFLSIKEKAQIKRIEKLLIKLESFGCINLIYNANKRVFVYPRKVKLSKKRDRKTKRE